MTHGGMFSRREGGPLDARQEPLTRPTAGRLHCSNARSAAPGEPSGWRSAKRQMSVRG